MGRRQASFDSKHGAGAYALELAKLWIDGKLRGQTAAPSLGYWEGLSGAEPPARRSH